MTRHHMQTLKRQQGAVLIIAVFIASVIVAIAARFTSDFQLSVARTGQHIVGVQLQEFLFSVEDFAAWTLIQDAESDQNSGRYAKNGTYGHYDHLQEAWALALQAPIEDATVEAKLEDALSRFNLNQLEGRPSPYNPSGLFIERFTPAQQRFSRLLQTHPDDLVDKSLAEAITEAVIDWIDTDSSVTGQGGAESNYYESLGNPYRAADRFFSTVTELRQVKGVTQEIYDYIEPFLIALPSAEGFNINTASVTVMRSLNQLYADTPLDEAGAGILIAARPIDNEGKAYESVEEFLTSSDAAQVFNSDPTLWPEQIGLKTGSEYFILTAEVTMLDYKRRQISILKRKTEPAGIKIQVIRRTLEQL
jgi:general secretion pathway protein K